jgi:RNA polymerase sigma factor for flagellar operon FliA
LEVYGSFGLLQAIESFDQSLKIKFETYGVRRIRGAILDEQRSSDWVPRTVRTASKTTEKAKYDLMGQLSREPSEAELAAKLGLTVAELRTHYADAGHLMVESLSFSSEDGEAPTFGGAGP